MHRQKSEDSEQPEEPFQTTRIGVKEYPVYKDITHFFLLPIRKPSPHTPIYALLLSNELLLLFDHDFGKKDYVEKQNHLADLATYKINLRVEYRLPPFLHIKMRHSANTECVFILLNNGHIAVFNQQFYLLGVVQIDATSPTKIKHCLDYDFYEKQPFREVRKIREGYFIFLFSEGIELHQVQIHTNHKLSKFKPSYKIAINTIKREIIDDAIRHPVRLHFYEFKTSEKEIAAMSVSKTIGDFDRMGGIQRDCYLMCCNCSREVSLYFISKNTMQIQERLKLTKICEGAAVVQDVQASMKHKRIFLSLSSGHIKCYSLKPQTLGKLVLSNRFYDGPLPFMHLLSSNKILAYSQNSYINIVSLHNLSIEQRFKTGHFGQIQFINGSSFLGLGMKSNSIYSMEDIEKEDDQFFKTLIYCDLTLSYRKIYEHNSQVALFHTHQNSQVLQMTNNSLIINKFQSEERYTTISTYLPPKSVSVRSIGRNIFTQDEEYWILTEKSQIYQYRISEGKVGIEGIIELHKFLDKYDVEYRFNITCFIFCKKTVPLQFDTETADKFYPKNIKSYESIEPVCLGTFTGEILIVSAVQPLKIILRLKYLDSPITWLIQSLPLADLDSSRGIFTYGSQKVKQGYITEITSHTPPVEIFRLDMGKGWLKGLNDSFFSVINGASFNIFYYSVSSGGHCECYKEEHYTPGLKGDPVLTTISYAVDYTAKYVVTGYSLGQIIVWKLITDSQVSNLIIYPTHLIQNSKEEPVQYAHHRFGFLYFNLGSFIVSHKLPEQKQFDFLKNTVSNVKMIKGKGMEQFNLKKKAKLQNKQKPKLGSMKQIELPKDKQKLILPRVNTKVAKNRSTSLGLISPKPKVEYMFHFPDAQLYRSIINRSYIH